MTASLEKSNAILSNLKNLQLPVNIDSDTETKD